ncbi:hypothetical protein GCM10022395_22000 [Snuella lapsa]|uniref:Uncharacterized protein n=1 Tax=Snuella lapsa TaxID=870481 RepID=A0ABP6XV49_9FLAO
MYFVFMSIIFGVYWLKGVFLYLLRNKLSAFYRKKQHFIDKIVLLIEFDENTYVNKTCQIVVGV